MQLADSIKICSVSLIFALALMSACSTAINEAEPPLAVMPSTGTVGFNQFISVFGSACLANFPNAKGAVTQLEKLGFETVESHPSPTEDYSHLFDKNRKMRAEVGKRVIVHTGSRRSGSGAVIQNACNVSAELKDAETSSVAPLILTTPDGNELLLNPVDGHDFSKSGELLTQGGIAIVNFNQLKSAKTTIQGRLPEECNGLTDCIIWGEATLEVWMNLDE